MPSALTNVLLDPRIREAFPALNDVVYLNTGTYGIMPAPALQSFQSLQAEFETRGVSSNGEFSRKAEETRRRLAALIGASAEEIAFTRNATDGINLALAGIDWRPGDEVITTDQEHEAMMHPLLYLHNQRGLNVRQVEVSPDPLVMIQRLENAWSKRTRLVAASVVTCETGTRLPAHEISAWAAERGLLTLFDGAQVSGVFAIDVREIGCDFYTSNGHKWLSGPKGTGFFYCRGDRLPELFLAHVGAGSLSRVDLATQAAEPFVSGQRFEFGTRAFALYAGLGASLDWFESLGWHNVYRHIAALSDDLKSRICERDYLRLISPLSFEDSSGLVAFVIEGRVAQEVSTRLREKWKIYTRVIPHYNALRLSTAHFNQPEDLDRFMDALDQDNSV
jgi:selenocysteine lyase/cysteine desulfurase